MRALYTILMGLILMVSPVTAQADDYGVPANQGRITDTAGVFSKSDRDVLATMLKQLEDSKKEHPQVLILTMKGIPNNDIETFAVKVVEAWKPGQKGVDNGLLMVFNTDPANKQVRFEVGYGLEPFITDTRSRNIIERRMVPLLKGQNPNWYKASVEAINAVGRNIEAGPPPKKTEERSSEAGFVIAGFIIVLLSIGAFVLLVYLTARRAKRSLYQNTSTYTPSPTYSAPTTKTTTTTTRRTTYQSPPPRQQTTRRRDDDDDDTASVLAGALIGALASGGSSERRNTDNDWSPGGGRSGGGGSTVSIDDSDDSPSTPSSSSSDDD